MIKRPNSPHDKQVSNTNVRLSMKNFAVQIHYKRKPCKCHTLDFYIN